MTEGYEQMVEIMKRLNEMFEVCAAAVREYVLEYVLPVLKKLAGYLKRWQVTRWLARFCPDRRIVVWIAWHIPEPLVWRIPLRGFLLPYWARAG